MGWDGFVAFYQLHGDCAPEPTPEIVSPHDGGKVDLKGAVTVALTCASCAERQEFVFDAADNAKLMETIGRGGLALIRRGTH